jgi:hypothetical protein
MTEPTVSTLIVAAIAAFVLFMAWVWWQLRNPLPKDDDDPGATAILVAAIELRGMGGRSPGRVDSCWETLSRPRRIAGFLNIVAVRPATNTKWSTTRHTMRLETQQSTG